MTSTQTSNLASSLEDIFTITLRVRHRSQPVQEAAEFRREIRLILRRSAEQARALGYSGPGVQHAIFAVVAFLDESVLNLQDPVFGDWSRRPLQEELFGGHLAGETFYLNLRSCLQQQDSTEVADLLEVHCLCLLLGYRGRYAFGDGGAVDALLRQARQSIRRIRGEAHLTLAPGTPPPALDPPAADRWRRPLLWSTASLVMVALVTFIVYELVLASGVRLLQGGLLVFLELA